MCVCSLGKHQVRPYTRNKKQQQTPGIPPHSLLGGPSSRSNRDRPPSKAPYFFTKRPISCRRALHFVLFWIAIDFLAPHGPEFNRNNSADSRTSFILVQLWQRSALFRAILLVQAAAASRFQTNDAHAKDHPDRQPRRHIAGESTSKETEEETGVTLPDEAVCPPDWLSLPPVARIDQASSASDVADHPRPSWLKNSDAVDAPPDDTATADHTLDTAVPVRCFRVMSFHNRGSWSDALDFCAASASLLLTIKEWAQLEIVEQVLAADHEGANCWIGARQYAGVSSSGNEANGDSAATTIPSTPLPIWIDEEEHPDLASRWLVHRTPDRCGALGAQGLTTRPCSTAKLPCFICASLAPNASTLARQFVVQALTHGAPPLATSHGLQQRSSQPPAGSPDAVGQFAGGILWRPLTLSAVNATVDKAWEAAYAAMAEIKLDPPLRWTIALNGSIVRPSVLSTPVPTAEPSYFLWSSSTPTQLRPSDEAAREIAPQPTLANAAATNPAKIGSFEKSTTPTSPSELAVSQFAPSTPSTSIGGPEMIDAAEDQLSPRLRKANDENDSHESRTWSGVSSASKTLPTDGHASGGSWPAEKSPAERPVAAPIRFTSYFASTTPKGSGTTQAEDDGTAAAVASHESPVAATAVAPVPGPSPVRKTTSRLTSGTVANPLSFTPPDAALFENPPPPPPSAAVEAREPSPPASGRLASLLVTNPRRSVAYGLSCLTLGGASAAYFLARHRRRRLAVLIQHLEDEFLESLGTTTGTVGQTHNATHGGNSPSDPGLSSASSQLGRCATEPIGRSSLPESQPPAWLPPPQIVPVRPLSRVRVPSPLDVTATHTPVTPPDHSSGGATCADTAITLESSSAL